MKFLRKITRRTLVERPENYVRLRNVGWGPFALPGERRREINAHLKARKMMNQAEAGQDR